MKKPVLLFDLDDTLIVELASAEESFIAAARLAESRCGICPEDLHRTVRVKAREVWYSLPTIRYCLDVGISSWEGMWAEFGDFNESQIKLKELKPYYRLEPWKRALAEHHIVDDGLAEEMAARFPLERRKKHVLFPEVLAVLKSLHQNHEMVLITNGTPCLQREKIKGGGLSSFFRQVVISGEVNSAKPDIGIFKTAMAPFESEINDFIMIGDSLTSDIAGAKAVGIRSVWINRDNKPNDTHILPDFTVKSLSEILPIIEESP